MILNESKLNDLMESAKQIVRGINEDVPNYTYSVYNAKSNGGICHLRNKHISISKNVAQYHTEEEVLNTCVHEILHSVAYESYGCNGHTGAWKTLASKVNNKYNMNIKRCYKASEAQKQERIAKAKYTIKCVKCGETYYRSKRSNLVINPNQYTCMCGGKLEVIQNF